MHCDEWTDLSAVRPFAALKSQTHLATVDMTVSVCFAIAFAKIFPASLFAGSGCHTPGFPRSLFEEAQKMQKRSLHIEPTNKAFAYFARPNRSDRLSFTAN
jgi:hypothetical protein